MSQKRMDISQYFKAPTAKKVRLEELGSSNPPTDEEEVETETHDAPSADADVSTETIQTPSDIAGSLSESPCQPYLKHFPFRKFGERQRNFHSSWYTNRPWLEYSICKDTVFCYPCRFFRAGYQGPGDSANFVLEGFSNWKKALDPKAGLRQHENSTLHKNCMVAWEEFKKLRSKSTTETSVSSLIDRAYALQVEENRSYIKSIIKVVRFAALQGVALRGHRESSESENRGNVLELLNLLSENDPVIKKHLESRNSKYTHHDFQNEILAIIGCKIMKKISKEVHQAKHFSIMVDESKDVSKCEQLSIVVRYCLGNTIFERFVGFSAAEKLDAASLFYLMKTKLNSVGIDIKKCVAQTYDGASVMSGCCAGVQALMTKEVPQAIYTHCFNHRLNLVIVAVCHKIKCVIDFFSTIQTLYIFMSGSNVHSVFLKSQENLKIKKTELKKLSDTRWSCQYSACLSIKQTIEAIILTLNIIERERTERAAEASGLLHSINFSFIFNLCFFTSILKETKILSDFLQSTDCDIGKAINLVDSIMQNFKKMIDNEEDFTMIWTDALEVSRNLGLDLPSVSGRKRNIPSHLQEFLHNIQDPTPPMKSREDFKNNLFNNVLTSINDELQKRFSFNSDVLMGVSALYPTNKNFLNVEVLKAFAMKYECDYESLVAEVKILQNLIKKKKDINKDFPSSIVILKELLDEYEMVLSEIHKLVQIALTIPATAAPCERTFSSLRLIKSYLRSTMVDSRLNNLALIYIEKQIAKDLDLDDIVDDFATSHNNRRINLF